MEEKWSIDKQEGSNWDTWKFQMKHLLMVKGIWGLVDGSEVLAHDATAATQALYRSRLQKAFSTIVLAIDHAQLYLVTSCEEPKQAWDTLKKNNYLEQETLATETIFEKAVFSFRDKRRYIGGTIFEEHGRYYR